LSPSHRYDGLGGLGKHPNSDWKTIHLRSGWCAFRDSPGITTISPWARLVDWILKGAKPGDVPFELLTRYELIVNLKTDDNRSAKSRGGARRADCAQDGNAAGETRATDP
jgi:hypothetical protein